ncbi:Fic family protein [Patescibacteria group bacterium]|nr:Fic family protein [Patescibacteria group bacterium]
MRYKFTITNKILVAVSEIEVAREIIDGAVLVPEWEMKFREDALIRMVHFGTHVEGNDLSRDEAQKIVRDDPARDEKAEDVAKRIGVVARERDVQEVINYRNVVRFVDQLVRLGDRRRGFQHGERELAQLHSLAMEKILPSNELGVYRRMPVSIRGPKRGEIVGRPPLPIEVPYQMEDFWTWLKGVEKNEVHPVLLSGIVHFELVRIHPFIEGNGRVARAFSALILSSFGYDVKRFFSVEKIASVEKSGGELTEWLEYYTEALASEMSMVKERVRRLSMDARYKNTGGKQIALSERQIALMEVLQVNEKITMKEAREMLPMVSDDTILRDLNGLVKKKLVKKQGKTKGVKYVLKK